MNETEAETPKFIRCPLCDYVGDLTLKKETHTKIKGSKVVKGIFDVWYCPKCNEGFTNHWEFAVIETNKA